MPRNGTRRLGYALALLSGLFAGSAAAEDARPPAPLRIAVSTSGRAVFDRVLEVVAGKANLTGQYTVRYTAPLRALRDFCLNDRATAPHVVLVPHRLHTELAAECARNGAEDVVEVELARDALVLATRAGGALTRLTSRQVYLAIAREVPYKDEFTRNTAVRWADIDPTLPTLDIRFLLPLRDEGSRATFDALVLEGGCRNDPAVKKIFDAQQRTARCVTTRSDRVRELPRDQAAKVLLDAPVGTVAVLSQLDVARSGGALVQVALDEDSSGPDLSNDTSYDFSNSYWLFARGGNATAERMARLARSEAVIGPDGPLPQLGLVLLSSEEREVQRAAAAQAASYGVGAVMGWVTATAADTWTMISLGATQAPQQGGFSGMDLTSLMDVAGYQVINIQSSIGIIPNASMTFGITREMSDADHDYLVRVLYRDSLARPGALSAMQRRIVRSVMAAREVGGFEVSKVEIDFLPLPKVALELTPKGRGRSGDGNGGSE